ncbi:MFS transporter [Dactylosporangium sp. CS-047395]|uniref:MFS transporter n=1 Tax=Dactylosporangium sp. CS-047395 TaxID=3239936 RepID=UPI003D93EE78
MFRLLWLAAVTSALGNGMRWVALPLLAAGQTGDPWTVSLVTAAEQLPWLLFGLFAGVLADRLDRRRLAIAGDLGRAAVMVLFTAAVACGFAPIAVIAALGFVLTCGDTVASAALAGLLPAVVPADQRATANGRLAAGVQVTDTLIGSTAGAALFGAAAIAPFAVDAATFLASAACLALLRLPANASPAAASPVEARPAAARVRRDLTEGVRLMWAEPAVRGLCLLQAVISIAYAGILAVLVLFATRGLGLGPAGFGLLVAVFAVGGVAGGVGAGRLAARFGLRRCLLVAVAVTALCVAALGLAGGVVVALAAAALLGAGSTVADAIGATMRQRLVPDAYLGRVTNAFRIVGLGAAPAGALGAGALAHAYGLRTPFLAGAVLVLAGLAACAPQLRDTETREINVGER